MAASSRSRRGMPTHPAPPTPPPPGRPFLPRWHAPRPPHHPPPRQPFLAQVKRPALFTQDVSPRDAAIIKDQGQRLPDLCQPAGLFAAAVDSEPRCIFIHEKTGRPAIRVGKDDAEVVFTRPRKR